MSGFAKSLTTLSGWPCASKTWPKVPPPRRAPTVTSSTPSGDVPSGRVRRWPTSFPACASTACRAAARSASPRLRSRARPCAATRSSSAPRVARCAGVGGARASGATTGDDAGTAWPGVHGAVEAPGGGGWGAVDGSPAGARAADAGGAELPRSVVASRSAVVGPSASVSAPRKAVPNRRSKAVRIMACASPGAPSSTSWKRRSPSGPSAFRRLPCTTASCRARSLARKIMSWSMTPARTRPPSSKKKRLLAWPSAQKRPR